MASSCRDAVLTALAVLVLSAQNGRQAGLHAREVYAEVLAGGTSYAEPTSLRPCSL
jgi:hypothetical protein